MLNRDRPLLAVLIDADNESAKLADSIIKEISSLGEPGLRRVYGDWSNSSLSAWSEQAKKLGFVMRQATAHSKQKNSTDIELVIDAMDILREGRFDGFVLVSGDSDFTALGNRLREDGKIVIGMGTEAKSARSFVNICNQYIYLDNISGNSVDTTKRSQKSAHELLNDATQRIQNAIARLDPERDWHTLSAVGAEVNRMYPDFDTRTYGHAKLSTLIKSIPRLEFVNEDNQAVVRVKD